MTLAEPQFQRHPRPPRYSREEYYRLIDIGVFNGRRAELIEGAIFEMAAMKDLHAVASGLVERALRPVFPDCWIRQQLPLSLNTASDPEPDFAVVPGDPRDYKGKGHPTSALLVVEVSDTSLQFDRIEKASLYAKAGLADYWILNLIENTLEIRRDPEPNASGMFGYKYRTVRTLAAHEFASPLERADAKVAVADLLP